MKKLKGTKKEPLVKYEDCTFCKEVNEFDEIVDGATKEIDCWNCNKTIKVRGNEKKTKPM